MKKYCLIIVFFSFLFSNSQPNKPIIGEGVFNKTAEYAELTTSESNKKASFFRASFQYSTPSAPIDGEKCAKKLTIEFTVQEIFFPRSKYQGNIDGAYFGTTFPHLFLMTYGYLKPQKSSSMYVPKIFGFKVCSSLCSHCL